MGKTCGKQRIHTARIRAFFPVEEVASLAGEIEAARVDAGISYEMLSEGLRAERLRTLREKYPDYAARHETS